MKLFWLLFVLANLNCTGSKELNHNDCKQMILHESIFLNYLKVLKKYEIPLSIQKHFDTDKTLIFYFRNKGSRSKDAGTLLVLDSNANLNETYSFQSCCDSSVFEYRIPLDSKKVEKLKQINYDFIYFNDQKFCECRKIDVHEFFEVVFTMRGGKIASGILIEGGGNVNPFPCANNSLLMIREILM